MFLGFENHIFGFVAVIKLEQFSGKPKPNHHNCLNQNFTTGIIIGDNLQTKLRSKTNTLNVWKQNFSLFCNFLSDENETILSQRETKAKTFRIDWIRSFWQGLL